MLALITEKGKPKTIESALHQVIWFH